MPGRNMESPNNIGWVCDKHSPKPNSIFFDRPFSWFVGKYCKLGFPTGREEAPHTEFMWVKVTEHMQLDGKTMLVGDLDNDPLFVENYKCGDGVAFDRNEICDVA